jgi:hypothetical protein
LSAQHPSLSTIIFSVPDLNYGYLMTRIDSGRRVVEMGSNKRGREYKIQETELLQEKTHIPLL